jgi:hypothetical protein
MCRVLFRVRNAEMLCCWQRRSLSKAIPGRSGLDSFLDGGVCFGLVLAKGDAASIMLLQGHLSNGCRALLL